MMESSVIVDIDSESRLMFATNSSGVVLISHFGTIGFSAEEFQYYQCLFKLTDTESIGKLRIGNTSLSSILRRSNLRDDVMEKLLFLSITSISDSSGHDKGYGCSISLSDSDEVNYAQDEHEYVGLKEMSNGHKTEEGNASCGAADSSQFLSLHQWLLLCKLILQLQLNPWAAPDGSLLEVICSLYEFDNQHLVKTDGFTQPPSPLRLDDTPDGRGIVIEDKLNQGNRLSYVEKAESSNGHTEGGYTRNRKWKVPSYGCFANFRLGVAVTTQDMIAAARVAGWEVCSEGFQKPYTKFSVSVTTISCSSESKNKNAATGGDGDGNLDAITATALRGNKTGGIGHLNGVIIPGMQEALPSSTSPSVVEPMPVDCPLVPVTTSVSVVSTPASVTAELPLLAKASPEIAVTISPAPVGGKKNKKGAKKKTIAASVAVAAAAVSAVSSSVGGAVLDSALCAADSSLSSHADPRVLGSVAPSSSSSSTSPSPVPPRVESGDTSSSTSSSNSPFYEKAEANHNNIFAKPLQHSFKDEEHQCSSSSSTDCSHHVDRDNCINAGCERATDKENGRRKETAASDIVYEGDELGQFESQRRYSDFEALVSVLQRLYRGVILPPLPPKTWLTQLQQQTQSTQLFAVQRMAELQLFLSALLAHPLMRYSFEVSLFLRASKAGLNSFRLTFPLFSFDSNGAVIANCKNKNLAKSSTEYLSDATFTARAAAAGIVNSIWDLGSAFLSSNGYAVGDRRLRSGSNLSESSVTSNSNSDRGDRVEEKSSSGFDQRSKHHSITNGKVMTADKDKDKEKDKERVQGCSGVLERDADSVKKGRGCESATKGRLEFAHRNPLSVAHTVVPSSRVGVASASAPCTDILKGLSGLSDSRGSPVNDPVAQYQQQQWGGPVTNGHISTSEPSSSSSSSGHYSASANTQAPSDEMSGLCQVAGHGVIRGSHKDYRAECPIASTFNMTQALAPTPAGGEPLDSLEGSLQQLLKMLGAAGCVGDKLDALLSADGNNLYALSQFGYYLKQSADAHAAERWSLHTSTHALNGAIETVAKSLQVFYEDQHKQNVTPVLFLGRYLQPTNAAIMQKARAASAVELSLLEEQHKKKALDIARKTKGVSEEVLSRCIDELAAAEEEVEGTRRDEARLGSLLKTESSSLIEIQKRSMQVYLHSFAASRAKQHAACLEVWEDLYSILADPTMPPSMISSAAWPSGEASGAALIERFL